MAQKQFPDLWSNNSLTLRNMGVIERFQTSEKTTKKLNLVHD